jgi:lipopolysaccharide export system permease protein
LAFAVTVARYISGLLAMRLALALLALSALLELFDLFNNARELLSRGGTLPDLVTYAALRLPITVENALPIAMLVGALATFLSLARSNEMTALRTAGLTVYRIVLIAAPTAIVAGLVHFVLIDIVTPWSERRFVDWWSSFEAQQSATGAADNAVWLRSGDSVVRVGGIAESSQTLSKVKIVRLSDSGTVVGWIDAESAKQTPAGWTLQGVRTTRLDGSRIAVTAEADRPWSGALDPASIVELTSPTRNVSTTRMREILRGTRAGENSPSYYQTRLYHSYAFPFASLLMLLLAAPAAYSIRRHGGAGRGLALGFGLGMAYLVTDGLLSAFGEARVLPPLIAAGAAPVLFALIGGSVLVHYEQ